MNKSCDIYQSIVTSPFLWIFAGLTLAFYGVQWLTAKEPRGKPLLHKGWFRKHYVSVVITLALLLAALALVFYLAEVGLSVSVLVDRLRIETFTPGSDPDDLRALAYAVAALLGIMAAAATIFFSIIKVWINERQTTATEQGHITDRINQAVEGLGAEKTSSRIGRPITVKLGKATAALTEVTGGTATTTRIQWRDEALPYKMFEESIEVEGDWQVFTETTPNLEVRIGAIYALERIMQDSLRDHIQIMEILCAYIRQNAQPAAVPLPEGEPTPQAWRDWAVRGQEHPRLDVDVALRVIERRGASGLKLEEERRYRPGLERAPLRKIVLSERKLPKADLSQAHLQGADLKWAQLQGADLSGVQLQGADLGWAELQGADLGGAQLQGADLREAQLQRANIFSAQMQGAELFSVQLQGADLGWAHLQGANLFSAQLQGADLFGARLQGTDLRAAQLQGADLRGAKLDANTDLSAAALRGAALQYVDSTDIPQITNHLGDVFADASVTLPGGKGPDDDTWPDHWPKEELDYENFNQAWRAWQKSLSDYDPQG